MHISKWFSGAGLVILALIVLFSTLFTDWIFKGARVDLTEGQIYTLSDGSKNIVSELDKPLELYFFFSQSTTREALGLRNYAKQVRELLEEYVSASKGKIKLTVIDPEPFSEDEDRAAAFGLEAVPINNSDTVYFGLVAQYGELTEGATAEENERPTLQIPFFQAERQRFLEYDIAKMIHQVSQTKKPVIGLLSGLQVDGGFDMMTRQPTAPWFTFSQLKELFEVMPVAEDVQEIPVQDYNLLLVVHPKELSEETLFAIDQYVLRGGHAVFFVDPFAELDRMSENKASQDLNRLFNAWGVNVDMGKFIGDAQLALQVSGQNRQPVRHLGILQLTDQNLARDSISTSQLETLHMSSTGFISTLEGVTTKIEPLMTSSEHAMPIDAAKLVQMDDPLTLMQGFTPDGKVYSMGVRITGEAQSAFPEGVPISEGGDDTKQGSEAAEDIADDVAEEPVEAESVKAVTDNKQEYLQKSGQPINVVIVADTDVLTDRLWVQVQEMFGQQIASPFADNGNFFFNTVELLSGSSDLIDIRGQGRYFRPFTVVKEMRRAAEEEFQSVEQGLQQELQNIEQQLTALQNQQGENGEMITLTPEVENQLEEFRKKKLSIRKQLRDVQHQLNKDIEALDFKLKLINIALVPFILTLIVVVIALYRRRKRG